MWPVGSIPPAGTNLMSVWPGHMGYRMYWLHR